MDMRFKNFLLLNKIGFNNYIASKTVKSIFLIYFMLISFLGHCASQEARPWEDGFSPWVFISYPGGSNVCNISFNLILWKVFAGVFVFLFKGMIFPPLSSRCLIIMTLKLSSSVDSHSLCLEKTLWLEVATQAES